MADAILGLDIGTNSTKAVLFDVSGAEVATAEQAYVLSTPSAGWAEQDPEALWQAVLKAVRTVVRDAGDGRRVLALATAAHGLEPTVRRISGWLLHPGLPLPNIAWLRQNRPEIFDQAGRFLGVTDFLNHRLAGRFVADYSSAAEMQLVNATSGAWSQQLCELAGITGHHLSELEPAGVAIGRIKPEVAGLTGLPEETLIVNGGHDQCCTALAMEITSPGKIMLSCGTAWVITAVVESPAVDMIPAGMDLNFHVVSHRWTVSQLLGGFGATLEWWLKEVWPTTGRPRPAVAGAERYEAFNQALEETEPGSRGLLFLPLGGGSQLETDQARGGFLGLRLDHTRADMGRAVLEGSGFEVRWGIESLRQAGMPVERLFLVGGATRSSIWPQILADVVGVPISISPYTRWPALGAALLAGVGAGAFESIEAGQTLFHQQFSTVEPDQTRGQMYDAAFAEYKSLAQLVSEG
jgi:sugar (pentulose or hexulose) kinase